MKRYHESQEMYLETIYLLKDVKKPLISKDVANELGFTKPSVSRAIGLLEDCGYITRNKLGEISLTDTGLKKATEIYERHHVITELLISVGADKNIAEDNACRIEHVISDELFDVLKNHVKENHNG